MIRKRTILITLVLTLLTATNAEEILFVKWGDLPKEVKLREAPDGRYGPQSFYVAGDTIWILDSQNNLLKSYVRGRFNKFYRVPRFSEDFLLTDFNSFIVLSDNRLFWYEKGRLTTTIRPPEPLPLIRGINKNDGKINVVFTDGRSTTIDKNRKLATTYQTKTFYKDFSYKLSKEGEHDFSLRIYKEGKEENIGFHTDTLKLGSVCLAGFDTNFIVIDADFIIKDVPLEVSRRVMILSSRTGEVLTWFEIPTHYYSYIYKDLYYENGFIYHMVSSTDGIHIFRWDIKAVVNGRRVIYPQKVKKVLHYNFIDSKEWESGQLFKVPQTLPYVTRAKALQISETYVNHTWTCRSDNITNGPIQDPDGNWVETPEWVTPGNLVKIPYQWGGFSTLSQFDTGIQNGMYAGDKNTEDVSRYARGVDCSGFVSRCWTLTTHYSTSMMPNITKLHSSWSELKPADAIHKVGHVRLCVNNNPDGTILAIEASGIDWRVNYHTYRYFDLVNYSPRYYVNIIDSSVPPAQPTLLSVLAGDSATIRWRLNFTENVDGFFIEYSNDGISFSPLFPDSLIPENTFSAKTELNPGTPLFLKVYSANTEASDSTILSFQSDAYGTYNNGEADKILIVDGFDRTSDSWVLPYHSFALWMGRMLYQLGIPFETVANEMVESEEVNLEDYKAVFWILGDESTADETFSSIEQEKVKEYLKNGGQLFVSGSEVAWDLDYKGGTSDKYFFHNYLKATYVKDDAEIYTVEGLSGTIFEGLSFTYDDGSHGIYEENYPDVINPANGSIACLKYSGSNYVCGIQYEGLFPEGTKEGKLVYFGIPWETIINESDKKETLRRIATYFGFQCTGIDVARKDRPEELFLSNGYPNPFNSMIRFKLYSPYTNLAVYIYDILGRQVKQLNPIRKEAGNYEIIWDGTSSSGETVGSGEYFLVVNAGKKSISKALLYLK